MAEVAAVELKAMARKEAATAEVEVEAVAVETTEWQRQMIPR